MYPVKKNLLRVLRGEKNLFIHPAPRGGFTLVEVVVSILILALLFSTILVAFHRTTDATMDQVLRERAVAVAQRHLELLLASRQEPNSLDRSGQDDLDPFFSWQLKLSRESVGSAPPSSDLANTVIKAEITVRPHADETQSLPDVRLVRYFANLKPIPGFDVAVPITPDDETLLWFLDLREQLGREPSASEVIAELIKLGKLPPEISQAFLLPQPSEEPDEEDTDELLREAMEEFEKVLQQQQKQQQQRQKR